MAEADRTLLGGALLEKEFKWSDKKGKEWSAGTWTNLVRKVWAKLVALQSSVECSEEATGLEDLDDGDALSMEKEVPVEVRTDHKDLAKSLAKLKGLLFLDRASVFCMEKRSAVPALGPREMLTAAVQEAYSIVPISFNKLGKIQEFEMPELRARFLILFMKELLPKTLADAVPSFSSQIEQECGGSEDATNLAVAAAKALTLKSFLEGPVPPAGTAEKGKAESAGLTKKKDEDDFADESDSDEDDENSERALMAKALGQDKKSMKSQKKKEAKVTREFLGFKPEKERFQNKLSTDTAKKKREEKQKKLEMDERVKKMGKEEKAEHDRLLEKEKLAAKEKGTDADQEIAEKQFEKSIEGLLVSRKGIAVRAAWSEANLKIVVSRQGLGLPVRDPLRLGKGNTVYTNRDISADECLMLSFGGAPSDVTLSIPCHPVLSFL